MADGYALRVEKKLSVGESNPAFARSGILTGACTNRYTNRDMLNTVRSAIYISLFSGEVMSPKGYLRGSAQVARYILTKWVYFIGDSEYGSTT